MRVEAAGAHHDIASEGGEQGALVVVELAVARSRLEQVEERPPLGIAEAVVGVELREGGEVALERGALVRGGRFDEPLRELAQARIRAAPACRKHDEPGNGEEAEGTEHRRLNVACRP